MFTKATQGTTQRYLLTRDYMAFEKEIDYS